MHERTISIMRNLGFDETILNALSKPDAPLQLSKKTLRALRRLGVPKSALEQIKFLETPDENVDLSTLSQKDLIESLIKKCKRTFDAFAAKSIPAKIVFQDAEWTIFSENYTKEIEKLHRVCKPYFDNFIEQKLKVEFLFDGSPNWKVITEKESDLPESI